MVWRLATCAVVLALLGAGTARAQDRRSLDELPRYELDPVVDGALGVMAVGFAGFSELAIRSGELAPQTPAGTDTLLGIDRWVAERSDPVSSAGPISTVAVAGMLVWGGVDALLTETVRRHVDGQGWAELAIYAEVAAIEWAIGNMAKLAVRRPRPRAYREYERTGTLPDTDSSLSFYSLHTAFTAGLTAATSYVAWARDPGSPEAWLTLALGSAVTIFTGVQRILALAHFPTDVMAGALFGTGIGLIVPHLHRADGEGPTVAPLTDGQTTAGLVVSGTM